MKSEIQSKSLSTKKHIHPRVGITIVLACALVAGVYTLSEIEHLTEQLSQSVSSQNEALIQNAKSGGQSDGTDIDQTEKSVWDTLQTMNLQADHYVLKFKGSHGEVSDQNCIPPANTEAGSNEHVVYVPNVGTSLHNNKLLRLNTEISKRAENTQDSLVVHDACTTPLDGDDASISLPQNENGYFVLARTLGKPTSNPELIIDGSFMYVTDDLGSDFLVLGILNNSGFQTPKRVFSQTDTQIPADISGLFAWSGEVCSFNPVAHCFDSSEKNMCSSKEQCCMDTNADEVIDSCIAVSENFDGSHSCTSGAPTTLSCREYVNEWIFNIDEFSQYLWNIDDEGNFEDADILFFPVR